jgi:hypothetical protein
MVRYITRTNRAHGINRNKWVFSHNGKISTKKW